MDQFKELEAIARWWESFPEHSGSLISQARSKLDHGMELLEQAKQRLEQVSELFEEHYEPHDNVRDLGPLVVQEWRRLGAAAKPFTRIGSMLLQTVDNIAQEKQRVEQGWERMRQAVDYLALASELLETVVPIRSENESTDSIPEELRPVLNLLERADETANLDGSVGDWIKQATYRALKERDKVKQLNELANEEIDLLKREILQLDKIIGSMIQETDRFNPEDDY